MSKGLEAFNNILCEGDYRYFSSLYDRDMFKADITTVKKELQALKILKEKLSPLAKSTFLPMTQEEFKILNEVLNDEH